MPRHVERRTGRLPTAREALGVVLEHAIESWGGPMRDLHGHQVRFRACGRLGRSRQPGDAVRLLPTCGACTGSLRRTGRAPDRLLFELGIRPDGVALERFHSGDRRAAAG